jgi:hypothetical protein
MRDVWNWWKVRRTKILTVFLLGIILIWMSMGLWQAERLSRAIVREVRGSFLHQETKRQEQFTKLLTIVEEHLSRQDANMASRREEHLRLVRMLDQLARTLEKPAAR